jgi:amidohydrolase
MSRAEREHLTPDTRDPTPDTRHPIPSTQHLIEEAADDLVAMRRDFHAHPELSFQEVRTAGIVADRLRELGLEVRDGVGKTGVVGSLRGHDSGRIVALRADIDALPIREQNDVPYVSRNADVMHACGHDGHTAILLTVARVLSQLRDDFAGEVRFVFQPGEETAGGAPAMLADGAFAEPKPRAVFGLHLWNNLPVGMVGVRDGPLFAHTDELNVVIKGSGGHGAMPHQTVDPVVVAAQVVLALQTMVSRETSPLEPAVLTIGSIHGGTAFNIVPSEVRLQGTVRTFTDGLQAQMRERIESVVRGITSGMRASYSYEYVASCPAVVNEPRMSELVRRVAMRTFGEDQVTEPEPTMGGDDMSYFLREAPGAYFFLGSANPERGLDAPHHHPRFDIDEAALPRGARLLAEVALEFLARGSDDST